MMQYPASIATANMATSSLFVYGTLMAPEVLKILIGRVPQCRRPAILRGYARHPVRSHVFPGMIALPSSSEVSSKSSIDQTGVSGVLLVDLLPLELRILDLFEGDEYQRILAPIQVTRGIPNPYLESDENDASSFTPSSDWEEISALTYLWARPVSELILDESWSYDAFREDYLDWYLKHTVTECRSDFDKLGFGTNA